MPTRIRITFFVSFVLLFAPVHAGAFEVPYQRIFQQRDSRIAVDIYSGEGSRYFQCDLDQWNCVGQGTSTPDLFPELAGTEFILSPDQAAALVATGTGAARQYAVHVFGAGTTTRTVLDFTGEIKTARFSDDNEKILFTAPAMNEFIVFDIKANVATQSIPIKGGASFVRFSPHGNYVAYYSASTTSGKERIYTLVDIARDHTYTWKEQNDYWDLLSEEEKVFDFSPDESRFFYLSDRDGTQTLYMTRLALLDGVNGRLGKRMFKTNFTVNNFLFGADGLLYFTANRKSPLVWSLYSYDIKDELVRGIADDVLYWPPPQRAGKFIVFLRSQRELPVLFALHTQTRVVEALPIAVDAPFSIGTGKIRNFSGRYGVLYTPDNYDKKKAYPLVVWLHGGPHRQTSPSFHSYRSYGTYDAVLEQLRRSGFIVLKLDYRGSYGYGKKFATELKGNVGNLDVKDVIDATTALKKEMKIGEVFPMGTSYGGYLALRALVGKPALFAGAISINGVTDWWTLINNDTNSIFAVHFNGIPSVKNKKLYDQASIFLRLDNMKDKKILLASGEDDATVPNRQTSILYDALTGKGIASTLVSYANEGHVLKDSEHIGDLCDRVVKLPAGYAEKACAR